MMKKKYLINSFLFLFIFAQSVFANNEKYRLTYRDNPSTSIVIGWNQTSGSNPVVHYDTVDHGTNFTAYAFTKTVDRTTSSKGMSNQFARLTGLQPNTAYYFVIRDSQGTSQRFWFKTIPDDPSIRLSIVAGGDSRNNRTPRQNANRLVAKLRPHAVFFGGDMTSSDSSSQWNNWMDDWQLTIGSDGRMIPIVVARGNHDASNTVTNLFDIPTSSGGEYYALSFGGNLLRSYTLNTEITPGGSQGSWLTNDLAANADNHYWSTAQYHRATRPHQSGKSEQNDQYQAWSIPFHTYGVQLVMESDSHVVKTTWPVIPSTGSGSDEGFVQNNTDPNRTVYVGEGCWGAPLRSANDTKNWTRASGSFNQFKWLWINQSTIELRTINVNNATSVGQVSDSNLFNEPLNINVWGNAANRVVFINNPKNLQPDTEAPTAPNNLVASNITENSVNLSWNASTDNTGVSGYDVYQGNTIIASVTQTTNQVTGLSANTDYNFSVRAKDAAGNVSTASTTLSITTLAPDTTSPSAPTNLTASNINSSSVSLSWNAATDNIGVTSYQVFQDGASVGTSTNTNFNATSLTPATAYTFTVKALDAGGNVSANSNTATVTTTDAPVILPTVGITTIGTSNAVHASRRAMPYTMPENGILKSIAIHTVGGSGDMQLGVYADNSGKPGNKLGQTAVVTTSSVTGWQTIALENPVTVNNGATIWLAWIFSNNPGVTYVTGSPGRFQASGSSWSSGGNNMPTSYGDGSQSNFIYSVYANYEPAQADTQAPTAPTALSTSNVTESGVSLSWTAATDNIAVTSYDVYQGTTIIATVTGTSYTVSGLTGDTTYSFTVRAKDAAGNQSTASNQVTITTETVTINYCDSASTNTNDEFIGNVELNTINNTSGAQFYSDFTTQSTTLTKGSEYTITVTPIWTGTIYNEGYSVWIDYNKDGDFEDSGELVWSQSKTKNTPVSGSFSIPSSATESVTRMRVSMKYNDIATSCESFQYGEVEDYTIVIQANSLAKKENTIGFTNYDFSMYPNPVKGDILNIKSPKGFNTSYAIINMNGQVVKSGTLTSQKVNVSKLEAGLYFISINDGQQTITKKFLKK